VPAVVQHHPTFQPCRGLVAAASDETDPW
jgi:hypothetical protein